MTTLTTRHIITLLNLFYTVDSISPARSLKCIDRSTFYSLIFCCCCNNSQLFTNLTLVINTNLLYNIHFPIYKASTIYILNFIFQENKHLRSLPLVDSPENMILLGSVQRYELIKLIEKHIGREKRLEMAAKWQKEAQER